MPCPDCEDCARYAEEAREARDEVLLVIGEFRTALTAFYQFNGLDVNPPDRSPIDTPSPED